jgi:hypothetical protein
LRNLARRLRQTQILLVWIRRNPLKSPDSDK